MKISAVPAKAAAQPSGARASTKWGLAFAGTAALLNMIGCARLPAPPSIATAGTPPAPYRCLLPAEQRTLVAELFFGRNIRGRQPLTDREWASFAAAVITPNFPAGFTVFDGEGQWRNPDTGHIAHERTKVLLVAAKRAPALAGRLSAVIDAYRARFRQQSVGIITRDSCAAF